MTHLSGFRIIDPEHRIYEVVSELCIAIDTIGRAAETVYRRKPKDPFTGDFGSIKSKQFPIQVTLPAVAPVYAAFQAPDKSPTYEIGFTPAATPTQIYATTAKFRGIFERSFSALFVVLFERYRFWIESTFGTNVEMWPEIWRFAWAIRNSAVHSGKFNMKDKTRRPVVWHSLSYDHRNDGQQIIGIDLSIGDIFILIVELSDDLDCRGAPILK